MNLSFLDVTSLRLRELKMAFWCVRSFPKCVSFLGLREVGERGILRLTGIEGCCSGPAADVGTYDWVSPSLCWKMKLLSNRWANGRHGSASWNWKFGSGLRPDLSSLDWQREVALPSCTGLRKYSAWCTDWSLVGRGLWAEHARGRDVPLTSVAVWICRVILGFCVFNVNGNFLCSFWWL